VSGSDNLAGNIGVAYIGSLIFKTGIYGSFTHVLNLTLAFGHTSPIIASGILNPALAYLPCSRALHVKCRLLPEDLITSPNISA